MEISPKNRQDKLQANLQLAVKLLLLLALIVLLPMLVSAEETASQASSAYEDVASLEKLARQEALGEFPALNAHQRLEVGPIDRHTEVLKCMSPIKPVLATPHHMADRATIELRCQDPKGWHLYVQAHIVGTSNVVVAAHSIVPGMVLKESDLKTETHDVTELPLGYLDDAGVVQGLTASRPIAVGAYITNQMLVGSKAVQRGQLVTLVADAGGMSISMKGRALSDGLINQRVKVTNLSSGKVVEGVARSEQIVEIILQ